MKNKSTSDSLHWAEMVLGIGAYMGGYTGILQSMRETARIREKENAGIISTDGFEGIPSLNIPVVYDTIVIKGDYFYCFGDYAVTVFTKEGKKLFTGVNVVDYKQGMFLVAKRPDGLKEGDYVEKSDIKEYALYNMETRLTDYIFKPYWMCEHFNEYGFVIVNKTNDFSGEYVINKEGEILYEHNEFSNHSSLYGVVLAASKEYINLLTDEVICEKSYHGTLETKECLFIQIDKNCVYQISKVTGEYIIHGEKPAPKPEPFIKQIEKTVYAATPPKEKPQQRNDLCACGSGKKFKNCCLK